MKLGSAFYTSWRRKVASHPIVHVLSLSLLLPTSSFFLSSLSLTINPNPFCCCRSSFYCFLQLFWVWGIGNPLPTPSPPPTSRQSGSVNARDCAWSKWHWKDPTPPPPQCFCNTSLSKRQCWELHLYLETLRDISPNWIWHLESLSSKNFISWIITNSIYQACTYARY